MCHPGTMGVEYIHFSHCGMLSKARRVRWPSVLGGTAATPPVTGTTAPRRSTLILCLGFGFRVLGSRFSLGHSGLRDVCYFFAWALSFERGFSIIGGHEDRLDVVQTHNQDTRATSLR